MNVGASHLKQKCLPKTDLLDTYEACLSKTKEEIESELSNLISRNADLRLHELLKYAVLSHGKRLRPLMVILSAQSVGGNLEKVMPLALAIELLHTSTLIHDDILDQDKFRRHLLAVHEKWCINDAILAGDAVISLAIKLLASYGKDIITIASETGLALCDGQFMDVSITSIKTSENEYLEKIWKKSASLFKAATQCGALAGGGSISDVKCLSMFGKNFGLAYQLRDDLRDITIGNDLVPKDLKAGRITLPLIHLYHVSNSDERKNLERFMEDIKKKNQNANKVALNKILQRLVEMGSIAYCERKLDEYLQKTETSIALLKDSIYKTCLIQIAKSLKD